MRRMRWFVGVSLMGMLVSGVANAAMDQRANPNNEHAPAMQLKTPSIPTGKLQADRPDFRPPYDYRPAHPSDELHRFPNELPAIPLKDAQKDQSTRTHLRG